jgi:cysteine desulfurase
LTVAVEDTKRHAGSRRSPSSGIPWTVQRRGQSDDHRQRDCCRYPEGVIYADYNATTPCLPEVIAAVAAQLARPGNPSARQHAPGRQAGQALEEARERVARLMQAEAAEVIFTSGATEACNLAVLGVAERLLRVRPRFVTVATEHPAVLEPHRRLRAAGAEVVILPVDDAGRLAMSALTQAVDASTALVSVMAVNNETGVIHDVGEVCRIAHAAGALVLCDATQGIGRSENTAMDGLREADFLACSAHKLYGPQGAGALRLRRGLSIEAQIWGGGQERALRAGTHNLPGLVGFGVAAAQALTEAASRQRHLARLSDQLEALVVASLPGVRVLGAAAPRAPGTSFFCLPGLTKGWLPQLATVAASGGSSCLSASGAPSHVALAMGVSEADAGNSIRISLGLPTTSAEVEAIARALVQGAQRLLAGRVAGT